MADPYGALIPGLIKTLNNSTSFNSNVSKRIYFYDVPSSATFPYVTGDISLDSWTTIGMTEKGEVGTVRFVTYGDTRTCSITKLRTVTGIIDTVLDTLETITMTGYTLVRLKRNLMSPPIKDPEDDNVYYQIIDFDVRIQEST